MFEHSTENHDSPLHVTLMTKYKYQKSNCKPNFYLDQPKLDEGALPTTVGMRLNYDAPYTGTCNCNDTLWHTRPITDAYRGERNTHRTPEQ